MPSQKPFVPPPEPLNKSTDPYKFQGISYNHLEIEINLKSLKTIVIAILLGVPYLGLIHILFSSGSQIIVAMMIAVAIFIGGGIGLLYYLNTEEPVKPPSHQNKRR
ncbi:hypothetical protein QUA27_18920 [Microcoleus sp. Pol14C6]|uniref:hypothetical protein n=1 Tax=unclassified Microcoleus TaxID=2642155 RepID=UPI002FD6554A